MSKYFNIEVFGTLYCLGIPDSRTFGEQHLFNNMLVYLIFIFTI